MGTWATVLLERPALAETPRQDIGGDLGAWARLLALTQGQADLCGALYAARSVGAALVERSGGWALSPGELDSRLWAWVYGQYLAPHAGDLARYLARLGTWPNTMPNS